MIEDKRKYLLCERNCMYWVREEKSYLVFDQDANDESSLDRQDEREEGVDVDAGEGAGDAVGQAKEIKAPWQGNAVLENKWPLQKMEHGCWIFTRASRLKKRCFDMKWPDGAEACVKCTSSHAPSPTVGRPHTVGEPGSSNHLRHSSNTIIWQSNVCCQRSLLKKSDVKWSEVKYYMVNCSAR